ncbi:MAG: response regulator [Treponema sp.]|nr:response regulator [Treponema sp.]
MSKMVFVGPKDKISTEYFNKISMKFASQFVEINGESVNKINEFKPELAVVYVYDLPFDYSDYVIDVLMNLKDIPVVLYGTKAEYNVYEKSCQSKILSFILAPILEEELAKRVYDFWINIHIDVTDVLVEKTVDNRKKVLVIDDDPISLRQMMNMLKDSYKVAVVKSGPAALEYLTKEVPDIILLDYEMPGWDGVQTLEMIRANKDLASIPILFLTGVSDRELVTEALKHKPQGYILKNSDRNTIISKVASVLK